MSQNTNVSKEDLTRYIKNQMKNHILLILNSMNKEETFANQVALGTLKRLSIEFDIIPDDIKIKWEQIYTTINKKNVLDGQTSML